MRYPSLTWFEVSNLNITCDIPKLLWPGPGRHGTRRFSYHAEFSKPSTNSCSSWSSKRKRASSLLVVATLLVTVAQACQCTRVHSLHVRGYGCWFSPSTGQLERSGWRSCNNTLTSQNHRLLTRVQGYPGLSQCIWWYSWLTPQADIKSSLWTSRRVCCLHADPVWLQLQLECASGLLDWN